MEDRTLKDIAEDLKAVGLKWTELLSRHSVAMGLTAEDRNEIAGEVYNARQAFEALLNEMCAAAQMEAQGVQGSFAL